MAAAAAAEDKTEKSPVTPGPIVPARELYGAMLLERGRSQGRARRVRGDAQEGAASPRRHARCRAKAAEQAGDAGWRGNDAAAVALGEAAEPVRPEITAARAFVTKVN